MNEINEAIKAVKRKVPDAVLCDAVETAKGIVVFALECQPFLYSGGKLSGLNPNYPPHREILAEAEEMTKRVS